MAYAAADKRVLITGASSGLGAALARQLARRQAVVGLIARRRDRLAEVLADCRRTSPGSAMWVADLADTSALCDVALRAWDVLGGIDVLVNNAAIPKRRPVAALEPDEVEDVMRVNFFAPMRLTLALLPRMLARGSGLIVNVSSDGSGISVKLIEPGPVDTEIWDQPGSEEPLYQGPKVAADEVAEEIIEALGSDTFEHYVPDMKAVVDAKNADLDAFIAGVAGMAPR